MTGYGRGAAEADGLRLQVEMRGLNAKGLDIPLYLPPALLRHDLACREAVRDKVARGRVEVRVTMEFLGEEAVEVRYSEGAATALGRLAESLAARGTLVRGMTLSDLLALPDAVKVDLAPGREEAAGRNLMGALAVALEAFSATRRTEGERLLAQFRQGADALRSLADRASTLAEGQPAAVRERLQQKVRLMGVDIDPGRLEQEAALAGERADVAEELVRLHTHLEAMGHLLEGTPKDQGKRLDHLLQEMQREVSTLLAKADLVELTQVGLEMRLVVEQLREQTQNVA